MAFSPGTRLGHYDVTALLGEGGMGQVWQAIDTQLNRQVALKILPDAFAADPDRLARFKREAQILASLNHPNIAAIYGIEEAEGTRALVLELVEGPTLADRIKQGPIPVDEALPIAKQIAEALEAAHEQGVIHRDLNPANIKVRDDGTVKVLDFGLAKALDPSPDADPSQSPTLTAAATQMGVILGTAAYMSPEQARGKTVDKRADIWAFGVVVYEMLTGVRPFRGDDVSQTLAQVIERAPDFLALPRTTPSAMRRLLRRCLDKEGADRLRDIGDARLEIEEARATPESELPELSMTRRTRREQLAWLVSGVSVVVVLVTIALSYSAGAPEQLVSYRTSLLLPGGGPAAGNPASRFALSPDGTRVAFTATDSDGQRRLWVRSLDTLTALALVGTEGAYYPIWSPDGRFLAFQGSGASGLALQRVAAAGGPVVTICQTSGLTGGTWNLDDVILFSSLGTTIQRVSASGGTPSVVTVPDTAGGGTEHREASFLPDGRHFLYVATGVDESGGGASLYVGSLDPDEQARRLVEDASNAQYADGHIFFVQESVLMARPFDAERLEFVGAARPVAADVDMVATQAAFSVSNTGVLAYQAGSSVPMLELAWFDRTGERTGTLGDPRSYRELRLSQDRKVAVGLNERGPGGRDSSIWVFDVDREFPRRFTFASPNAQYPVWSPESSRTVFAAGRFGQRDLYQKEASGVGAESRLLADADGVEKKPLSWSSDGQFILYAAQATGGSELWVVPAAQAASSSLLVRTANTLFMTVAEFSPDGRWVAFESSHSGRAEVYVASFPEPTAQFQVSTAGGRQPKWRARGSELFFIQSDDPDTPNQWNGTVMLAEVSARQTSFEIDRIRPLFRIENARPGTYDVTSDGERILALVAAEEASSSPITLVTNWPALLNP